MSVQGDFKDDVIGVEFISKKGKKIETSVKIPIGRKIRQSLILERKRRKTAREKLEVNGKISKKFCITRKGYKKTSQGNRKGVKFSSMNKHRKRSYKHYNSQGK